MICENLLCIYQHDDTCLLPNEVRLDWRGVCCYYCPIDLDHNLLQAAKRQLLPAYESIEFIQEYDRKYHK